MVPGLDDNKAPRSVAAVGSQDGHAAADDGGCFRDLAWACDQPVIICVAGLVTYANDAAIGVLGGTRAEQVLSQPIDAFVDLRPIQQSHPAARVVEHSETSIPRLDGARALICVAWMRCRFTGGGNDSDAIQVVMRDVAARRNLERQVEFLARNDALTRIPNRVEFHDRLVGAMARAQRSGRLVAAATLNIDGFHAINATHGTEAADHVLQTIATRLVQTLRKSDSAARVGGDEFALILEGIDQREQAGIAVNRICSALRDPIPVNDDLIEVTVSAGIAVCPADATHTATLLRIVDVAMYAAKAAGGNGFRFYFPEMETMSSRDAARREQLAARLASLTPREREVMDMLVEGNSNKAIGYLLSASPRTIENHRARVMVKMHAESLPDLVRMVLEAQKTR